MKTIKPKHLLILAILVALIATNPGKATFTEFLESQQFYRSKNERDYYGRKVNLFIFSLYTYNEAYRQLIGNTLEYQERWYIGIFGNFIPVTKTVRNTGYAYDKAPTQGWKPAAIGLPFTQQCLADDHLTLCQISYLVNL